jgi:uncharacterized damage-inducible protein DinB
MTETSGSGAGGGQTGERAELLERLARQRQFLRYTTRDLTDEQAAQRTCASELCLGGIIKHVTRMEQRWASFLADGPAVMEQNQASQADHAASFQMADGETLAGLLADYERAADRTSEVVAGLGSLDDSQELPPAPWFPPGTRWSHRQVLIHVICETAQHSGHADIVRESLDGAKTMG